MLFHLFGDIGLAFPCLITLQLVMTQTRATSIATSQWIYQTGEADSTMTAKNVTKRSKSTCAALCREMPQCSRFVFLKTSVGGCLLEDADGLTVSTPHVYHVVAMTTGATCREDLGFVYDVNYDTCIYHAFENDPKLTWYESSAKCVDLGGHLYNIQTTDKLDALKAYFDDKGVIPSNMWVGASDEAVENDWRWTDGSSATAMLSDKWDGVNPNNWGPVGEDYVVLVNNNWVFADLTITSETEGYICEMDM